MKKNLWIVLLIIITIITIILMRSPKLRYRVTHLSENNFISNRTDVKYLDTIVSIGLDSLDIKNVFVLIVPLRQVAIDKFNEETGLELGGHIIGEKDQYTIWVGNFDRSKSIKVLSHELIHLKQLYSKKLVNVDSVSRMWDGKLINPVPEYGDRPWEEEARKLGFDLSKKIESRYFYRKP